MSNSLELPVEGMHCTSCAQGLEKHLIQAGFAQARVSFTSSSAEIGDLNQNSIALAVKEIERLGYRVPGYSKLKADFSSKISVRVKVLVSLIFTLPLLLHMFVDSGALHNPWVQLTLALPPFFMGLLHFGPSAWKSLKAGFPGMDVLISLGMIASMSYSLTGLILDLGPNYLFFETAASIALFALIGGYLESKAVARTQSAVLELGKLQAPTGRKIEPSATDDSFVEIAAEQIKTGDLLLIRTGDQVPADGTIASGSLSVDESAITGESLAVTRATGSKLVAGTTVVHGVARMQVTASGNSTLLAKIILLVHEAEKRKPQIQKLGDLWSSRFVPVVLGLAILTLVLNIIWGQSVSAAMLRAVAVLVIACPCAMGLATPTAIIVALGRAAKAGILFRGGDAIERLAGIKQLAVDKTGTLTQGRFQISELTVLTSSLSELQIKEIIKGLEIYSSHPIGQSLTQELSNISAAPVTDINEQKGRGISGKLKTGELVSISAADSINNPDLHRFDLILSLKGLPIAGIILNDLPRAEAKKTLEDVRSLGISTTLISGDRLQKCMAIAENLAIDTVHARKLPQEKAEIVGQLQSKAMTGFFGDGINDAAALARAGIGISLSSATGAAINSADIVLLGTDIRGLSTAIKLARRTLRTIKQNLFWAFFYNVLAIPLAAMGFMSPIMASVIMAFSDVIVVGNSLRLKNTQL